MSYDFIYLTSLYLRGVLKTEKKNPRNSRTCKDKNTSRENFSKDTESLESLFAEVLYTWDFKIV